MKPNSVSSIICIASLLTTSIANAGISIFTDRASWLAAAAGTTQVSQDFNSFTADILYGSPVTAGFLTLSVVNGTADNSWRIDAIPAAFTTIPDVNGTTFATILVAQSPFGGTRLGFDSARAFGFDYAGASYSTASGVLTTSRGHALTIQASPNANRGFFGILYTSGETFTSVTLSSTGAFAAGIDNVSAFAPVPELPTSAYLFGGLAAFIASRPGRRHGRGAEA